MGSQKPISHIKAGVLIVVALAIFGIITYFAGIEHTGIISFIPPIMIVAGLIFFITIYGNSNHNQVTFGHLFGYGFKTTSFLTLILILLTVILILFFPEFKEKDFEATRRSMEEKRSFTEDEIVERLTIARKMFWVVTIGRILLFCAIVGAIGSVIGAAITKKKPINPIDQVSI